MESSQKEKIRRVLESVLARLENTSAPGQAASDSVESPVLLVVLGESGAHTRDAAQAQGTPAITEPRLVSHHPGLERFSLREEESKPHAPRMCFMEPGRECVESGACELRGY
jgi:hypothetical protein